MKKKRLCSHGEGLNLEKGEGEQQSKVERKAIRHLYSKNSGLVASIQVYYPGFTSDFYTSNTKKTVYVTRSPP